MLPPNAKTAALPHCSSHRLGEVNSNSEGHRQEDEAGAFRTSGVRWLPHPAHKGAVMQDVAEIEFEEIGIQIKGVVIGMFSGTASLDTDGTVSSLVIDGFDPYGGKSRARLSVPHPYGAAPTWDGKLAAVLAVEIQRNYRDQIIEALSDYTDSLSIREYDGNYASEYA